MEPSQKQPEEQQLEVEEDYPELGFHRMSSIAHPEVPQYPIVTEEVYTAETVTKDGQKYLNEYELLDTLGEGAYGKVRRVKRHYLDKEGKETSSFYAMKTYHRISLENARFFGPDGNIISGTALIENELNIIRILDHKNIARCFQIIDCLDHDKLYVVMELCDLGQLMHWSEFKDGYEHNQKLLDYLSKEYGTDNKLRLAKIIFRQLFEATLYLHERDISNRDIKVDNVLGKSGERETEIKMIDFTTARYSPKELSHQPAGTPGFRAPEHQFASEKGYSPKACDIWSLGICLYLFCFGKLPFMAESELELDIKCKNDPIEFPQDAPPLLRQLIEQMTEKDWKKRPTIQQVMKSPWYVHYD